MTILLRELGRCSPDFQFALFESNGFAYRAARIDPVGAWKKNQVIRQCAQCAEDNYGEIYNADYEKSAQCGKNIQRLIVRVF